MLTIVRTATSAADKADPQHAHSGAENDGSASITPTTITIGASAAQSGGYRVPSNTYAATSRNNAGGGDVGLIKLDASDHVAFGAALATVRTINVPAHYGPNGDLRATYGAYGQWVGILLANGANRSASFSFGLPSDFTELVKAVVVIIPKATGSMRLAMYTDFGASGEAYEVNTDSISNTLVAATTDQILDWDISAAFTGVAANDRIATLLNRTADNVADTCEGDILVVELLIEYR